MSPRPLWRWWLFCALVWLLLHTDRKWTLSLMGWCVLPEWLGWDGEPLKDDGKVPF